MSGFKFCRICLYFDGSLSSLLDGNGEYAEHLLLLTGVDVRVKLRKVKLFYRFVAGDKEFSE